MIRIHHATAKKATDQGVLLTLVDDNSVVSASKGISVIRHTDPKLALAWVLISEALRAEYPALQVISMPELVEGFEDAHNSVMVQYRPTGDFLDISSIEEGIPTLGDVLALCEEQDFDPEAEVEGEEPDEPETSGDVVKAKYKALYKERGNPSNCGDWLAEMLDGQFNTPEGTFSHEAFEQLLTDNGVPFEGKWTALPYSGQRGWEGRFRMTGRLILEKYVARNGMLTRFGKEFPVPALVLSALRAKHAKWLEKQGEAAKAAAAA